MNSIAFSCHLLVVYKIHNLHTLLKDGMLEWLNEFFTLMLDYHSWRKMQLLIMNLIPLKFYILYSSNIYY